MSQTPILDREQPLPAVKKKFKVWLGLLLGAAIGGLLAFRDDPAGAPAADPVWLIILLPAFYFGVLVHELGHLVAGLGVGFELRTLAVGPILVAREARGWKLRFTPRRFLVGGFTGMVPKSADRLVDRFLRLVLGGPAASLLLLIVTLVLIPVFPSNSVVRVLLYVSLFLTVMCCLPFTVRSQPTDAKSILLLIRRGPGAERLAAVLYILALDSQQVEPRDWLPELVDRLNIPTKDKSYLASAIFFRYAFALDSGDVERIAEAIERGLSINHQASPDIQRAFQVAASCFQGIFRHDAELAQAWLQSARAVKHTASRKDWDAKALASIALARGEHAKANELLTRHLAALDRLPPSGSGAAERARTLDLLGGSAGAAA
jgi:hypothetical protein